MKRAAQTVDFYGMLSPQHENAVGIGWVPKYGVHVTVIATEDGNQRKILDVVDIGSER